MDNIYSKFYTGNTSPFGIGTWDSNHRRKLNKSSSLPYFPTNSSIKKNNLILPPVNSKYENGGKYIKQYPTQSSSSSSTFRYDTNKNRKELSNYIKDINYSVANKLQNDNFIAQQKLNNLKNNYNEIKTLLNNKLEKLEQDQQMQFDNLKYALGQGGGLKMLGAVKNANGGNNYDLQLAEQEDIIDATRKLPKLLDKKINEAFGYKKYNKLRNGYDNDLMPNLRKMDDELKRQRTLDDMKFRRELDEIEAKRENMRHERQMMLQELQNQEIDSLDDPLYMPPIPPPPAPMYNYNPYNPYMVPPPPYFMPPMNTANNNSNNHDSMSELIKLFLIKKLFDDNKQNNQNNQQYPSQYQMPYMPMQPLVYKQSSQKRSNPYGYPPQQMMYPNYQNPMGPNPYMNQNNINPYQVPNGQGQKQENQRTKETESQKGIPFVDPLEKYLEMVNKAKGSIKKTEKSERKSSTGAKPIKLKNKKKDEDDEDDDDEENNIGEDENDGDDGGDDEGDGGDDEGDGDGNEDGDDDGGDEEGGGDDEGGDEDGGEEEGGEE